MVLSGFFNTVRSDMSVASRTYCSAFRELFRGSGLNAKAAKGPST